MRNADTNYFAIKPELLDEFLLLPSTLERFATEQAVDFEKNNALKSAVFCDIHADDCGERLKHSFIDYHFLHPTCEGSGVYDAEAVKKTLAAMQLIHWEEFNQQAHQQIKEAQDGKEPDWSGIEYYPSMQSLFEYADENNLYIVSFHDHSDLEGLGYYEYEEEYGDEDKEKF